MLSLTNLIACKLFYFFEFQTYNMYLGSELKFPAIQVNLQLVDYIKGCIKVISFSGSDCILAKI